MRADLPLTLLFLAALAGSAACSSSGDDGGPASTPACTTNSECPLERPFCSPAGVCGVCESHADCHGAFCTEEGICGCRDDADCAGGDRPVCTAARECAACEPGPGCSAPAPAPVIVVVQDRSGSMNACFGNQPAETLGEACGVDQNYDGILDTPAKSRMDVAQLVMQQALADHTHDLLYGLVLYGVSERNLSCGDAVVAVPVDSETAPAVMDMYATDPRIESPAGGTPTTDALRAAYSELVDPATDTLNNPERANYVLLITDGLMNCNAEHPFPCRCSLEAGCPGGVPLGGELASGQKEMCLDDESSIAEVRRLAQKGIKTFVIGLGDLATDPVSVEVLNELADAGEAPRDQTLVRFYPAADRAELQQAIDSLLESVVAP